jgi:hypothetical protein
MGGQVRSGPACHGKLSGLETRHFSKIRNGRHYLRSAQDTLARPKNIQKKILSNQINLRNKSICKGVAGVHDTLCKLHYSQKVPLLVLRIRDVYPRIPDPDFNPSRIPDPQQQQKSTTKGKFARGGYVLGGHSISLQVVSKLPVLFTTQLSIFPPISLNGRLLQKIRTRYVGGHVSKNIRNSVPVPIFQERRLFF